MKVFISHSHETKTLAKEIGGTLQRAGFEVWDHAQEIFPGDNWAKLTSDALEEAQAMVVLLSPHDVDYYPIRYEINFTLVGRQFERRLIPVFVGIDDESVLNRLPWILHRLTPISLQADGKDQQGIEKIAQALQAAA
jgi:hypothetical protein